MPQLMPLYWVCYPLVFMMLVFMMKSLYSFTNLNELNHTNNGKKFFKVLWLW